MAQRLLVCYHTSEEKDAKEIQCAPWWLSGDYDLMHKNFNGRCCNWQQRIIRKERHYKNGKLHGTSLSCDRTGQVRHEQTYKEGKLDGPCWSWPKKDTPASELVYATLYEEFEDGLRHGARNKFDRNGTVLRSQNFYRGRRHGKHFWAKSDGMRHNSVIVCNYYLHGCKVSEAEYTQRLTESGRQLAELVGFDEKALGALVALYAEVVI